MGKEEEDIALPDLPDLVSTAFRSSLTKDQNEAVDLAARLGQLSNNKDSGGNASKRLSMPGEEPRADADRLRRKIRSVARMSRMFKVLRQENETVIRLKGVCPGHKLKPGLLLEGKEGLASELELFGHAVTIDRTNEKRPGAAPAKSKAAVKSTTKTSDLTEEGTDFVEGD